MSNFSIVDSSNSRTTLRALVNHRLNSEESVELIPVSKDSSSRDIARDLSNEPQDRGVGTLENSNTHPKAKPSMISILSMIIFGGCLGWISGNQGINLACMYMSKRS